MTNTENKLLTSELKVLKERMDVSQKLTDQLYDDMVKLAGFEKGSYEEECFFDWAMNDFGSLEDLL